MKGIISSVIVLVAFLGALLVAVAFSADVQRNYDIVNQNAVSDRVFYKFAAVEHSVKRILENDLARSGFSVKIAEGNFNFVTFNVTLPSPVGNFSKDIVALERFAETRLNETNLVLDLNTSEISSCLTMTVSPYNITYGTINHTTGKCGFGSYQRQVRVVANGNSADYINGYDMLVSANRTRINPASASWSPASDCTGGTLNWTIRVVGNNTVYGPVTNMVDRDGRCAFSINENVTGSKIIQIENRPVSGDPNSTMNVSVQPGFNVTFVVTLNLTATNEKLKVGLSQQSIRVGETLYRIERNDTVTIQ